MTIGSINALSGQMTSFCALQFSSTCSKHFQSPESKDSGQNKERRVIDWDLSADLTFYVREHQCPINSFLSHGLFHPAKKKIIKRKQKRETSPSNMFHAEAKTKLFFVSFLINVGAKTWNIL